LTAWCGLTLLAGFAPGLASAAPAAPAPGGQNKPVAAPEPGAAAPSQPGAADAPPGSVEGVTVNATRSGAIGVPPDKAAAFAAQAAKDEAFRKYRESTPPLTGDPNDQSKDFPGLHTYVPQ
jgi:hypothetical protein